MPGLAIELGFILSVVDDLICNFEVPACCLEYLNERI